MNDSEKLEAAAAKYKAGKDREFRCDREFVKPERKLSTLEAYTKKIHEERFQRLQSNE